MSLKRYTFSNCYITRLKKRNCNLGIALPLILAIVWCKKKKEPFTTVLIGAATFMLFAIVIEKPLQALLIMPTSLGLPEHAASTFINARPVLWGIVVGLFPGVFEETGRLIAYKTVLRRRMQRETGLSHGIGHGGFAHAITDTHCFFLCTRPPPLHFLFKKNE